MLCVCMQVSSEVSLTQSMWSEIDRRSQPQAMAFPPEHWPGEESYFQRDADSSNPVIVWHFCLKHHSDVPHDAPEWKMSLSPLKNESWLHVFYGSPRGLGVIV